MDPITLLIVGAIAAPAVQILRSFIQTIEKERGEEEFEKKLALTLEDKDLQESLAKFLSTLKDDPKALSEAQALIKEVLNQMDEGARKPIEEGLQQPSERGRVNYITKLLEESNTKFQATTANIEQP
jgi:hypothetical protein